jgi:hypothetical protein
MPTVASGYGPAHRINIVKKVKVNGAWNFYPAVVESNGKLKDKVRIKGTVEVRWSQKFGQWDKWKPCSPTA